MSSRKQIVRQVLSSRASSTVKCYVSVGKYAQSDSDLKDLRTAILFTLEFFGLFRASELISIKAKDITIDTEHFTILLPNSKTDQYRNGNKVYIAKN